MLGELLPSADSGVYTAVLTLLIESALPLSMFGIITAALLQGTHDDLVSVSDGRLVADSLFNALFFAFCVSPHLQMSCERYADRPPPSRFPRT
jgi:hypothetical protein